MISNIIIADEELNNVINLFNYLQKNNLYINVVGIYTNKEDLMLYFNTTKIDILIINLNIVKNDKKIIELFLKTEIKIIVLSNDIESISKLNIEILKKIKNYFIKPYNFEQINNLVSSLCENKGILDIRKNIDKELSYYNFNKASIGYWYLVECIALCYENFELVNNLEKILFPIIAKKFRKSNIKSIKWNIQTSLNSMIRYTETKKILEKFSCTKKPTIKLFISIVSKDIISKYKN